MDNRAQSIGIARFFLSLIVGAILFWILQNIATPILSGAKQTTDAAKANQATTWMQDFVNYYPIMVIVILFIGLIVYSIYTREVLGT